MLRSAIITVFAIELGTILGPVALFGHASAQPLTFYSDEASWLNVEAGLSIAPYTGGTTVTDVLTTVETNNDNVCCNIIGTSSIPGGGGFINFSFNFSAAGDHYDESCFDGPPGCTVTDVSETINNPFDTNPRLRFVGSAPC
jgi:hypothetical protein